MCYHSEVALHPSIRVGARSYIGFNASLGENCRIGSRVSIGENTPHEPTVVGEDCHICRGSLVKENVVVGKNVSIGGCKEEYVITQGTGSSTSGHNGTNSTGNSTATNSSANSDMASPRTVIIAGNRIGDNVIIGYKVKMVGSVMRPIGSNTVIGDDTKLIDPDVGANTIIGDGVQCVKSSIGHNVVTGSGSAIIHTAMGNGSTVTPNATVTTCTIERGVMITGSHFTCNGATLVAGVSITGNNVTANCKDVNLAFIPPDNYASDNTNLTCHASANPDADQRNNARVYGAAGGSVGALVLVATAGMGAHFYRKHLKAKAKAQVRSTNVRLDIETASCDLPINHLVGQDKTHEDTPEYDHIFDSDQPMPEWPPEMVYQWVRNQPMEVSRYAHLFTDHSISGTVLCELPKEELERRFVKMGITLTGPRTLLLTLVAHELEQQKAAQKPRKTFGKITGDSSTSNPSLNIYMEPEDLAGNKRPSTNSIPVIDGDYLAVTNYAERKSSSLSQTGDQPTEGEQSETGSTEISRDINQQAESLYLEMPKMV